MIDVITWRGDDVALLDQRLLPAREETYLCRNAADMAVAIQLMVVRGAPAIGVAAAMGVALAARHSRAADASALFADLERDGALLIASRPTAVNLAWAVRRMLARARDLAGKGAAAVRDGLEAEARRMHDEDIATNRRLGQHGAALLPAVGTVLTHCNAGALATAGYGTALGVIRAAVEQGKKIDVVADETRPFLQGARLTAWELKRDGIPVTVITDGMAGHVLKSGRIAAVVVGADRIAMNGDVANKIGTYGVAVLAAENKVPFYVAAPLSTVDPELGSGDSIPIEERDAREVAEFQGVRVLPEGVGVLNPAFDVTPHRFVTAIITEAGVARAPYEASLKALYATEAARK